MFLTRREFHFEAYIINFALSFSLYLSVYFHLSRSRSVSVLLAVYFSRVTRPRVGVFSLSFCPLSSSSVFSRSFTRRAMLRVCMARVYTCVYVCVYIHVTCVCICTRTRHALVFTCAYARCSGSARLVSKRSYLTRQFMGALCCCR